MKKIILCSTQRSGTTMICEDFRNTGVLGVPEEYFIPWMKSNNINKVGFNWKASLENIFSKATTENNVFSIKIMANQIEAINFGLSKINNSKNPEIPENINNFTDFYEYFKNSFWVRVYRKDKVRQAISLVMARKTGICHAIKNSNEEHFPGSLLKGYKDDYNSHASLKLEEIEQEIQRINKDELIWNNFFDFHNICPSLFLYEDICKENYKYLYDIANHLNINIPKILPDRKLVKLSNSKNEHWVKKYQEEKRKTLQSQVGHIVKNANKFQREGKLCTAIIEYCRAIQLNPNFSWSYLKLGDSWAQQGVVKEAVKAYNQALKINPNSASIYYSLGQLCFDNNQIDTAINYFQNAVNLSPDRSIFIKSLHRAQSLKSVNHGHNIPMNELSPACNSESQLEEIQHKSNTYFTTKRDASVNFLVVGAHKAGTSWLHKALNLHSDISLHPIKELHFFDAKYSCGGFTIKSRRKLAWKQLKKNLDSIHLGLKSPIDLNPEKIQIVKTLYKLTFEDYSAETYFSCFNDINNSWVGEITPAYSTLTEEAIKFVRETCGDIKIIFLVRNPTARAWSHFRFHYQLKGINLGNINMGEIYRMLITDDSFLKACDLRTNYQEIIQNYSKFFSDINYIIYDDLVISPKSVLQKICQLFSINFQESIFQPVINHKENEGKNKISMNTDIEAFLLNRYQEQLTFIEQYFARQNILL